MTLRSLAPRPRSFPVSAFAVVGIGASVWLTGCGSAAMSPPTAPRHQAVGLAAASMDGSGEAGGGDQSVRVAVERRIVREGHLRLEVKNQQALDAALTRLRGLAKPAGGFIADEDHDGITLRVPTERLDAVMTEAATLGTVTRREITARDVTSEYVDLQARVDNLKTTEKRLRELLATTSNVTEILAVEKELTRVTQELESFEARRKLLQSQSDLATINIRLSTSVRPGPVGWVFYGAYTGVKWLFVWD